MVNPDGTLQSVRLYDQQGIEDKFIEIGMGPQFLITNFGLQFNFLRKQDMLLFITNLDRGWYPGNGKVILAYADKAGLTMSIMEQEL